MAEFFPLLGLNASTELWDILTDLPGMPRQVREMAAADRLPMKTLALLRTFSGEEQGMLAQVIDSYRLGTNRQIQLLEFCRDGRRRFGRPSRELLDSAGVWPLPEPGEQNVPQRTEAVFASLRRLFWPTLSRREEQFRQVQQRLGAAGRVRLHAWPAFEKREFRLEVTFSDATELARILKGLLDEDRLGAVDVLFDPLPDEE
jgi:hypothetical protein